MLEGDQLERICRALLRRAHAEHLWDARKGRFIDDIDNRVDDRSSGEALLVRAAMATWRRGLGRCDLGDIVHVLDESNTKMLGELLVALAGGARHVETWLSRHEPKRTAGR